MRQATIVTLTNEPSMSGSSSFEEAFGDYSEARGEGRSKRKKRRLERIANRREVKAARQEGRKERKVGRQEVRQAVKEARVAKRQAAQAARQAKRLAAMEARQDKKTRRAELRMKREAILEGPEGEMDETMMDETVEQPTNGVAPEGETQGGEDTGGYAPETGGTFEDTSAPISDEGAGDYQPQGGGIENGTTQEEEWGGTPPWMQQQEEEVTTPSGVYQEDNDDEYGAGQGTGDGDWGFDGVMGAEDRFFEMADGTKIKINPKVADVTKKIEWNKELISRLRVKKAKIEGSNGNPSDVNKQIAIRNQRILDLETQLQDYQNFEGEFSFADGRLVEDNMKRRRSKEVAMGRRMAVRSRRMMRQGIPVKRSLNPEFSSQRIVIPASSSVTGQTGLTGVDLQDDWDAPDTRVVELKSNADGKTNINWVGIGIGAVVAVGAIWALKKYKVI